MGDSLRFADAELGRLVFEADDIRTILLGVLVDELLAHNHVQRLSQLQSPHLPVLDIVRAAPGFVENKGSPRSLTNRQEASDRVPNVIEVENSSPAPCSRGGI